MTSDHTAGVLLVVGSVVFGLGAAVGPWASPGGVHPTRPQARLRMLTERLGSWRIAQPLYGLGPDL